MSDDLAALVVNFTANIDQLASAGSAIDGIFQNVASVAATSGADITESMTAAAEGFSSLSTAGEEAGSSLSSSVEQALPGFSALEDAIATLADSVNNAVSQIDAQIESIGTTAEESAGKAQSAGSGFNLGGFVNQVGMGIFNLQALGNMAGQAAQGLLGPAEQAENTQASFTNLLGSAQAASGELDQLNQFASRTQFKTQDIDDAAASLIAFKTPAQDVVPDLTAVGDALTAVGKGTPAEMKSVVDIIGKIGVQGKLTAGDITQLGAHGINAMDAIEKGSGLSQSALQKMIANGTLPAKDAIDDLTKGIEKNPVYSGGMAKQSDTLSGQMSTLSSDMDQVMASAVKPALPDLEKTLGKLTGILTSPSFKQFATVLGKDIAKGLDDVITGAKSLVDNGKNVADFFEKHKAAMDSLKAALIGASVAIAFVVVPAFWAWAVSAGAAAVATLTAAAPFIAIGAVVAIVALGIIEAVQHWGDIMNWIHDLISNVVKGIGGFFGNVGGVVHNITGGINDAWTGVGNKITGVWGGITGAVKGGINTVIDGINGFIGFIDGIQIHIPAVGVGPIHTPAFDWNGVGIRKIPHLATGGTVAPGGWAVAGDPGPSSELVYGGTSGLTVFSHDQSASLLSGGNDSGGGNNGSGETHVHNHIYLDGREMTNIIMTRAVQMLRAQGGGRMATL